MARVETSVVIERPVEEVFEFVTNPQNEALWSSTVIEQKQTSEGPMGVGATVRSTVKFLGRRFDTTFEVTEHEFNRKNCIRTVSGPIPATGCRTVEPVEGGTRLTQTTEAEIGGFFKLAEPIVVRAGKRQWESDLATLKDLLEARG